MAQSTAIKVTKIRSHMTFDATTGCVVRRTDGGGRLSSLDEFDSDKLKFSDPERVSEDVFLSVARHVSDKNSTSSFRICLKNAHIKSASAIPDGFNDFTIDIGPSIHHLLETLDNRFATTTAFKVSNREMSAFYSHPSVVVGKSNEYHGYCARFIADGNLPPEFHKCKIANVAADIHLKLKGGLIMNRFVSLLWAVEQVIIVEDDSDDDIESDEEYDETAMKNDAPSIKKEELRSLFDDWMKSSHDHEDLVKIQTLLSLQKNSPENE